MKLEGTARTCVGTGFIVLDIIRSDLAGAKVERRFAGGSCGNVLSILSYLGWLSLAVGRIGNDQAGRELIEDLTRWRVQTRWLRKENGRRTPMIIQDIYSDAQGQPKHRFFRVCPVCGSSLPAYRPVLSTDVSALANEIPKHSVFYFDRVSSGNLSLARISRENGALVVFEPSGIKNEKLFRECLKAAHIIKYSQDRLSGVDSLIAQARVPVGVETLGAAGLRARIHYEGRQVSPWRVLPAFSVPHLRDTAGSGDWCTAGLIDQIACERVPVSEWMGDQDRIFGALRYGQALATLNCSFEGARGLMYVAAMEDVRKLAAAMVRGETPASALDVDSIRRGSQPDLSSECSSCGSSH